MRAAGRLEHRTSANGHVSFQFGNAKPRSSKSVLHWGPLHAPMRKAGDEAPVWHHRRWSLWPSRVYHRLACRGRFHTERRQSDAERPIAQADARGASQLRGRLEVASVGAAQQTETRSFVLPVAKVLFKPTAKSRRFGCGEASWWRRWRNGS